MVNDTKWQASLRGFIVVPLLLTPLVLFTNSERAYLHRLNYLKNKVENYLLNFEAGNVFYNRQNLLQSAKYYELLIDKLKDSDVFHANLGFCRYYLGDFNRAVKSYETALAKQPHIYTYSWDLGMMYYARGDYTQAVKYLSQSLTEIPLTVNFIMKVGQEKSGRRGSRDPSLMAFRFSKRAERDEAQAIHALAQSYDRLGYYGKMLEVATFGLRQHRDHPLLLADRGLALLRMGRYKDAERIFSDVISIDPLGLGGRVYCYRSWARGALTDITGAGEDEAEASRLGMRPPDAPEQFPLHINFELIYLLYQS